MYARTSRDGAVELGKKARTMKFRYKKDSSWRYPVGNKGHAA